MPTPEDDNEAARALSEPLPHESTDRPPSVADDFFSPLGNSKPYVKIALEGFAGTGKTLTAALIAIGIHRRIESAKPLVIFDTELSAKFLKPVFDGAGIQVVVRTSRSLADLKIAMSRCRDGFSDVLLIDSLSHVWENFVESWKNRPDRNGRPVKRAKLEFQDWGLIKPAWKQEFSDPLVQDPYHILFTGRAGYEYENELVEDEGGSGKKKREIYKSGIKMKVEGETAYEPDILILMERFEEILTEKKKVWREATVIKDRSQTIDGKTFENPTYLDFAPAIETILKDPTVRQSGPEGDAAALVQSTEDNREWAVQRDIALEKIEAFMISAGYAGQAADAKKHKVAALEYALGTASWTEISRKPAARLLHGLELLRTYVRAATAGPEQLERILRGDKTTWAAPVERAEPEGPEPPPEVRLTGGRPA